MLAFQVVASPTVPAPPCVLESVCLLTALSFLTLARGCPVVRAGPHARSFLSPEVAPRVPASSVGFKLERALGAELA